MHLEIVQVVVEVMETNIVRQLVMMLQDLTFQLFNW